MLIVVAFLTYEIITFRLAKRALSREPVSLVSTIISSRPIFVVIYAIVLNYTLPHFLVKSTTSKAMLVSRFIATA